MVGSKDMGNVTLREGVLIASVTNLKMEWDFKVMVSLVPSYY